MDDEPSLVDAFGEDFCRRLAKDAGLVCGLEAGERGRGLPGVLSV